MKSSKKEAPYSWIDNPSGLSDMLAALRDSPVVAVDTESDSLYSYFEKVCLIQFSIPGVDYLVDPLAVDVTRLGDIFADERHEKIFHAAEYDIMCFKRDYQFTFSNLFDTMIAARVLGWKRYGLASILKDRFNVRLDKRMQRYNWGVRPLSDGALDYARLDTHYLLPLHELQLAELQATGRLTQARYAFEDQVHVEPTPKVFDPEDFWRIKGARDLNPQEQAILRQLYILRDRCARELDRPPFKVLNDAVLVRLAQARPVDHSELSQVKGLSRHMRGCKADDILKAIAQGLVSPVPRLPNNRNRHPGDEVLARYEALRAWRKGVASARGVEPDVILSNNALMTLAKKMPQTLQSLAEAEALNDWQQKTYGRDLLRVLSEHLR
jgi:ribonuclease D